MVQVKQHWLNILLGRLKPQGGEVDLGSNLKVTYFDQLRDQLDGDKSVLENVCDGDTVTIDGRPRHVIGYLQDFLFSPERSRTPVRVLSGGERNRLLLAKLFTKTSNFLVMDEPTNDLDVETLELLEELLAGYAGTLILVSHDRTFLDNVVTSTIVIEGAGKINEYVGGYSDWIGVSQREPQNTATENHKVRSLPVKKKKRQLSHQEQRELKDLPAIIEKMETQQSQLHDKMAKPEFFKQDSKEIEKTKQQLESVEDKLLGLFSRWEELESLR